MIIESLHHNDLNHLVLPLLSIDQFNSKIDNKRSIVVGFYCTDREPALDLMKFIEGSNIPILDTECSPAPNEGGYYLMFVEILRNPEFVNTLEEILEQVDNLVENDWKMKVWKHHKIFDVTTELLNQNVILDPKLISDDQDDTDDDGDSREETQNNSLDEEKFWEDALVDQVLVTEDEIKITSSGLLYSWTRLRNIPQDLGRLELNEDRNIKTLQSALGSCYSVWDYEKVIIIQHQDQAIFLTKD